MDSKAECWNKHYQNLKQPNTFYWISFLILETKGKKLQGLIMQKHLCKMSHIIYFYYSIQ